MDRILKISAMTFNNEKHRKCSKNYIGVTKSYQWIRTVPILTLDICTSGFSKTNLRVWSSKKLLLCLNAKRVDYIY
jgi:hypothetical protein